MKNKLYVDQATKFEWFNPYDAGSWDETSYMKNVRVWAEFLVESDQYFRRVNEFFDENK